MPPITIPISLQEKLKGLGPHFCLVEGKNPNVGGKGWQLPTNLMKATNPKLKKHLQIGRNYGVVAGGGLIIVEADDPKIQKCIETQMQPTFTVKSGGRGLPHYYFLCNITENKPLIDPENKNENIGHIKAEGGMVVGPESIHPSGRKYKIIKDLPFAQVRSKALLKALNPYLISKEITHRVIEDAKWEKTKVDINILQVVPLSKLHRHGDEYYGSHPIHGSDSNRNFWVNTSKNCWHCFRCESGGGPLLWLAVENNLIDCSNAHAGVLRDKLFWQVIKIARDKGLIKEDSKFYEKNDLKSRFFTDDKKPKFKPVEFAKYLLENYHFKTMRDNKDIYVYDKNSGIYTATGELTIQKELAKILGNSTRKYYMNDIQFFIEAETFFERPKGPQKIFAVENGLLNLETLQLEEFTPTKFIQVQMPIKYEVGVKCPQIIKFIEEIVEKKNIPIIQEMIGFCLFPRYHIHRAFMLTGSGANGKSTLIRLIKRLLGKQNTTDLTLHNLCNNRFAPAQLYQKLANLCPDLPDKKIQQTGIFKTLCGEDEITGENKFKDHFHFTNFAKLIFSANKVPSTDDDTIAFYRRWILINCPNTFSPEKIGGNKKANPNILQQICTAKEMTGFLNWALEGLQRIQKNGTFSNFQTWEQQRETYIHASNSAKAFIEKCLEGTTEHEDVIFYDDLYSNFCLWCNRENLPTIGKGDFTKNMNQYLPQAKMMKQRSRKKKTFRIWRYVKFVPTVPFVPTILQSLQTEKIIFYNKSSVKVQGTEGTKGTNLDATTCSFCQMLLPKDLSKTEVVDGKRVHSRCYLNFVKGQKNENKS